MANNAAKLAEKEACEPPVTVDKKSETLAAQIKKTKHLTVLTGAGVSTSTGESRSLELPKECFHNAKMQESPTSKVQRVIGL